jgi:hypothetical protein
MKAIATNKIRKYYKQGYIIPWTQPICTSNNSHGTFTGGGYFSEGSGDRAYYHVSDNSWPTSPIGGGWDGTCWGTTHSAYGWFNWALPKTIRITGVKVMARNYSQSSTDYVVSNAGFYTDSSKTTQIGDTFNLSSCGQQLVISNIPEDGIITDNLYFVKNGGGEYSGFAEIWITAYEWGVVEATESDYDFYKDFYEYSLPAKTERKYYKYDIKDFVHPTLTSNGLLGGSYFACGGQAKNGIYAAFDNNASTYSQFGTYSGVNNLIFYNPNPLKISSLSFQDYSGAQWNNGRLEYSDDGYTWTLSNDNITNSAVNWSFNVSEQGYHKYWKLTVTAAAGYNGSNWDWTIWDCWQLNINDTEKTIVEGTEQDYDFYKDEPYYKALKSYEKGQYLGGNN